MATVSYKVKYYAMQVRMGKMTIDEVPEEYREEVKKYLEGNG
jgi:hypothetical protein